MWLGLPRARDCDPRDRKWRACKPEMDASPSRARQVPAGRAPVRQSASPPVRPAKSLGESTVTAGVTCSLRGAKTPARCCVYLRRDAIEPLCRCVRSRAARRASNQVDGLAKSVRVSPNANATATAAATVFERTDNDACRWLQLNSRKRKRKRDASQVALNIELATCSRGHLLATSARALARARSQVQLARSEGLATGDWRRFCVRERAQ